MTLVAASSSSSAQSLPEKYDVFISFRGEDTRFNFTSHLYDALCRKHIRTHKDDQELPKGDEIAPSLVQAIEGSYISVVVFSENYASSRWCLDELAHILLCKRVQGQIVVPIFYKVDPSHVRNQNGPYKQAFERYERDPKFAEHKIQMWKQALHEAANLAGYDSQTFRDESEMIQQIVKDILQKLNHKYSPAKLKEFIGIENSCAEIELFLTKARTIGIWGMGGIGKSTIAKTIFSKYSSHYEGSCFLENVREMFENGLVELRHKFLSHLLKEDLCIDTSTTFFKFRLSRMQVFVVLDDITTGEQLDYLVGEYHYFGPGSKILITTRDRHVLISKRVDVIYAVKKLGKHHSYELFNLNAFNTDCPIMGYKELIERAVVYAKGIPLALKVLGSYLCGRSEVEWKSALRKLEKHPHPEIQSVLRLSYDGLDHEEKEIFLDIAFFLKGGLKEFVIDLLDMCGFHGAAITIATLCDKALISVYGGGHVEMHDLIQEMGLQVVREELTNEAEICSRLLDSEEIYDLLDNNEGSTKVQGIKLNVSQIRDIHLKADVFRKMPNIRYLIFYSTFYHGQSHVHLPKQLKFFPKKMRYLEWYGFPLKFLSLSTFCFEKIVKLSMPNSRLQKLWKGKQDFVSLQEIDLSDSEQLRKLPDLSKCLNLKVVRLRECRRLCYVHSSILSLNSLVTLDLFGCTKLRSLKSNCHLKSLQYIDVRLCLNLKEFAVSSDGLRKLNFESAGVEILHSSVARSTKLKALRLGQLVDPRNELSRLTSLTSLSFFECELIDDLKLNVLFGGMLSLRKVNLACCRNIVEFPNNIKHLLGLKSLRIAFCGRLHSLPELPPSTERLETVHCNSLEIVPTWRPLGGGPKRFGFLGCTRLNKQSVHNILEVAYFLAYYACPSGKLSNLGLKLRFAQAETKLLSYLHFGTHKSYSQKLIQRYSVYGCFIDVPGSKIPKWFKCKAAESSVIVQVPQISDLADFFVCAVIGLDSRVGGFAMRYTCYWECLKVATSDALIFLSEKRDYVCLRNDPHLVEQVTSTVRRGNQQLFTNIKLCFQFTVEGGPATLKECGVCPVYVSERQKCIQKMEMERNRKRPQDVEEQRPVLQLKKIQV